MYTTFKPKDIRKSCSGYQWRWKRNDYRFNAIAELCKWKKRNFIILNNFKELYTEILWQRVPLSAIIISENKKYEPKSIGEVITHADTYFTGK